ALPVPTAARSDLRAPYVAPRNDSEQAIAAIWQAILRVEKVGIHDNFFDLGGSSLLLVQVYNQVRATLKPDLLMINLFQYPTVAQLGGYLRQGPSDQDTLQQANAQVEKLRQGQQRLKQQQQRRQGISKS